MFHDRIGGSTWLFNFFFLDLDFPWVKRTLKFFFIYVHTYPCLLEEQEVFFFFFSRNVLVVKRTSLRGSNVLRTWLSEIYRSQQCEVSARLFGQGSDPDKNNWWAMIPGVNFVMFTFFLNSKYEKNNWSGFYDKQGLPDDVVLLNWSFFLKK